MNSLRIIDACTEEHFAAMSRSSPPGFRRAGAPIFYLRGRTEFARQQGFDCAKTLGTPDSRRDNTDAVLTKLL